MKKKMKILSQQKETSLYFGVIIPNDNNKDNNEQKRMQKKDLPAKSKKKAVYTVLDNTAEENSPMPANNRIHTIHAISTKEELKKKTNSLISTYFPTRDNKQIAEQPEQTVIQMPNSTDSLCSLQ